MSPIQIIFDSDDSDISDDSGVIVISSDEFEEDNEDPSNNHDDDDDGSISLNNAIDRSQPPSSPPTPKRQRLLWIHHTYLNIMVSMCSFKVTKLFLKVFTISAIFLKKIFKWNYLPTWKTNKVIITSSKL